MTKAQEYAAGLKRAPQILFESPDGTYRVNVRAGVLFGEKTHGPDYTPCVGFHDSRGNDVAIREENVPELVRFLTEIFGPFPTDDVSLAS